MMQFAKAVTREVKAEGVGKKNREEDEAPSSPTSRWRAVRNAVLEIDPVLSCWLRTTVTSEAEEWVKELRDFPPTVIDLNGIRLQCPRLATVIVQGGALRTLAAVSSLKSLTSVNFSECEQIRGSLWPLASLENLKHLELNDLKKVAGTVEPLSKLMQLETIKIIRCPGVHGTLAPLGALHKTLTALSMRKCDAVVGSLAPLEKLTRLVTVDMRGCVNLCRRDTGRRGEGGSDFVSSAGRSGRPVSHADAGDAFRVIVALPALASLLTSSRSAVACGGALDAFRVAAATVRRDPQRLQSHGARLVRDDDDNGPEAALSEGRRRARRRSRKKSLSWSEDRPSATLRRSTRRIDEDEVGDFGGDGGGGGGGGGSSSSSPLPLLIQSGLLGDEGTDEPNSQRRRDAVSDFFQAYAAWRKAAQDEGRARTSDDDESNDEGASLFAASDGSRVSSTELSWWADHIIPFFLRSSRIVWSENSESEKGAQGQCELYAQRRDRAAMVESGYEGALNDDLSVEWLYLQAVEAGLVTPALVLKEDCGANGTEPVAGDGRVAVRVAASSPHLRGNTSLQQIVVSGNNIDGLWPLSSGRRSSSPSPMLLPRLEEPVRHSEESSTPVRKGTLLPEAASSPSLPTVRGIPGVCPSETPERLASTARTQRSNEAAQQSSCGRRGPKLKRLSSNDIVGTPTKLTLSHCDSKSHSDKGLPHVDSTMELRNKSAASVSPLVASLIRPTREEATEKSTATLRHGTAMLTTNAAASPANVGAAREDQEAVPPQRASESRKHYPMSPSSMPSPSAFLPIYSPSQLMLTPTTTKGKQQRAFLDGGNEQRSGSKSILGNQSLKRLDYFKSISGEARLEQLVKYIAELEERVQKQDNLQSFMVSSMYSMHQEMRALRNENASTTMRSETFKSMPSPLVAEDPIAHEEIEL